MRKFKTVYMRGGTSKGCMFLRKDLPADRAEWDRIFLQVMGNPDPKQIDGMGGTVSSNNKIVIAWKSEVPGIDVEYEVGQVIVGKQQVDFKSSCGNMTSAVGPFAVEEGLVEAVLPITTVHMLNRNTDKYIDVTVPIDPKTGTFAQDGDCSAAVSTAPRPSCS
ncbi:PrpF domain-containing protein [Collinsella sp. An271]|uniref:PrpF domain-containing protein n=1 Tax=Collinsella sp. An271 TaxID=1965616 RepID=UPI001EF669B2|nr:PrpF domain-containing protein [Collinsella sp. An271]